MPTCDVWWASPVAPVRRPRARSAAGRARAGPARALPPPRRRRPVPRRARPHADRAGRRLDRDPAGLVFDRTCRCGEPHGKPTLDGGPAFSLTHAGAVVGVAVLGGGPVGLDVEPVRVLPDLDAMARHVGAPAEPAAFFRAWTRKEALLKATGDGLTSPMNAIILDEHGVAEWSGDGAPDGPRVAARPGGARRLPRRGGRAGRGHPAGGRTRRPPPPPALLTASRHSRHGESSQRARRVVILDTAAVVTTGTASRHNRHGRAAWRGADASDRVRAAAPKSPHAVSGMTTRLGGGELSGGSGRMGP